MISVIIPVYNDSDGIATTLDSIPLDRSDCEILVVDNASTDATPAVVDEYANDRIIHLSETEIQSSYAARNTGIRATDADILAFVDADVTVPDDWFERALDEFDAVDADYMGCDVELTLPENPTHAARYDHHTGFPVEQYLERQQFAPTCCLFVRREVFEDVGLFDHRLTSGGDKEFGNRVHEAGYDVHFAEDVAVYHPTRDTLSDLVEKDLRVGRGLCQLQRHHPDRYGTPGIPPRPSGVKSPDPALPARDRLVFGVLSNFTTVVRGVGYYREFLAGDRGVASASRIPELAGE